jgi:hypothetical protein
MPPRKRERVKKLRKAPKGEREGARSRGGFLFASLAVVGVLAASLWCAAHAASARAHTPHIAAAACGRAELLRQERGHDGARRAAALAGTAGNSAEQRAFFA